MTTVSVALDPEQQEDAEAGRQPRLECFALEADPPEIVPASPLRNWMEAVAAKHAYRCLPMTIANTHGWEILSPCDLAVDWTGGPERADLTVRILDGRRVSERFAHSNFSQGIVTFHTGYLFRTPPGWDLMATGPLNNPKKGIAPLSGIMETDWLPYPFTMNWMMTELGSVVFERGEPFCVVYPVPKQALLNFEPVIQSLDDDPALKADYELFRQSRETFFNRLAQRDKAALAQQWQRHYFRGEYPDGRRESGHVNKSRLAYPIDRRQRPPR